MQYPPKTHTNTPTNINKPTRPLTHPAQTSSSTNPPQKPPPKTTLSIICNPIRNTRASQERRTCEAISLGMIYNGHVLMSGAGTTNHAAILAGPPGIRTINNYPLDIFIRAAVQSPRAVVSKRASNGHLAGKWTLFGGLIGLEYVLGWWECWFWDVVKTSRFRLNFLCFYEREVVDVDGE